ncbi:DUF3800 domain-containing protein [Bradyrhizobium daqingense]|uniref:Uncharacterized protein DUF3800 n=1 Tax=Bradyrhizobium daqingense TaxID=993502 RepID=A0A562LHJ7_9BRAD|nr:uncharacterized protein DUF3800 [Bradyrhizobium daqingense]
MNCGFYLFVDEAGDEGLERIRPIDVDGASEYFVLCGVLVRTSKYPELVQAFGRIKSEIGLPASEQIHFRDLSEEQKLIVTRAIAGLRLELIAIVSNKRNMRGYRNLRCEARSMEFSRGRLRPRRYNWFYNSLFRYLLERASAECRRWTYRAYGETRSMQIIFSRRKDLSYSQTGAYLIKLKTERRDRGYFNNKGTIDWSVLNVFDIDSRKHKDEIGLQIADCAASAIYRALDESWFGNVNPVYLELLNKKFARVSTSPRDYGFKLLPDGFRGPVSTDQRRGLLSVGYKLQS